MLKERLLASLSDERAVLVHFLRDLLAVDQGKLYHEGGCSSLFDYCTRELGLCEGAAYRRITCARLLGQFPQVEAMLLDGRLCLTTLAELKDVLKEENADLVLTRAAGRSKREMQALVAELQPRSALRNSITSFPARTVGEPVVETAALPALMGELATSSQPQPVAPIAPPNRVTPLSAQLHRLNVTVSKEFMRELAEAKLALSHTVPDGNLEKILREGLRLILKQAAKRRALTDRPRAAKPCTPRAVEKQPRASQPQQKRPAIPAQVRREVFARDGGRCTFAGASGKRCGSGFQLQYDHICPVALGGPSTADNLRLLCAAHNQYAAELQFGRHKMTQHRENSTSAGGDKRGPANQEGPPSGVGTGPQARLERTPPGPGQSV